jgi:hypothetical protein
MESMLYVCSLAFPAALVGKIDRSYHSMSATYYNSFYTFRMLLVLYVFL